MRLRFEITTTPPSNIPVVLTDQPPNMPLPTVGQTVTFPMITDASGDPVPLYVHAIGPDYDPANAWAYAFSVSDQKPEQP